MPRMKPISGTSPIGAAWISIQAYPRSSRTDRQGTVLDLRQFPIPLEIFYFVQIGVTFILKMASWITDLM
jgi:hypothetical protein